MGRVASRTNVGLGMLPSQIKKDVNMTNVILPNWLVTLMGVYYVAIGIMYTIRFLLDCWYIKLDFKRQKETKLLFSNVKAKNHE